MLAYLAQPAADGRGNRREPRRGLRAGNTASPVTGQVIILFARRHATALNGDCKHFGELCAVNGLARAVALLERRKPRANVTCPTGQCGFTVPTTPACQNWSARPCQAAIDDAWHAAARLCDDASAGNGRGQGRGCVSGRNKRTPDHSSGGGFGVRRVCLRRGGRRN